MQELLRLLGSVDEKNTGRVALKTFRMLVTCATSDITGNELIRLLEESGAAFVDYKAFVAWLCADRVQAVPVQTAVDKNGEKLRDGNATVTLRTDTELQFLLPSKWSRKLQAAPRGEDEGARGWLEPDGGLCKSIGHPQAGRGVTLAHFKRILNSYVRPIQNMLERKMTTRDVVEHVVKPLTTDRGKCQFSGVLHELFPSVGGPRRVKYFISHSWSSNFEDLVAALESRFCDGDSFWFCAFCLNQFELQHELVNKEVFTDALLADETEAQVLMLDDNLNVMQRAWVIFEVWRNLSNGRALIILPKSFLNDSVEALSRLSVDLKDLKCTNKDDEDYILNALSQVNDELQLTSTGCKAVNDRIRRALQQAMYRETQCAMRNQARVLQRHGRLEESAKSFENAVFLAEQLSAIGRQQQDEQEDARRCPALRSPQHTEAPPRQRARTHPMLAEALISSAETRSDFAGLLFRMGRHSDALRELERAGGGRESTVLPHLAPGSEVMVKRLNVWACATVEASRQTQRRHEAQAAFLRLLIFLAAGPAWLLCAAAVRFLPDELQQLHAAAPQGGADPALLRSFFALNNLAVCLHQEGREGDAMVLYKAAWRGLSPLGATDPDRLTVKHNFAVARACSDSRQPGLTRSQSRKSTELLKEVEDGWRQKLGGGHPSCRKASRNVTICQRVFEAMAANNQGDESSVASTRG